MHCVNMYLHVNGDRHAYQNNDRIVPTCSSPDWSNVVQTSLEVVLIPTGDTLVFVDPDHSHAVLGHALPHVAQVGVD